MIPSKTCTARVTHEGIVSECRRDAGEGKAWRFGLCDEHHEAEITQYREAIKGLGMAREVLVNKLHALGAST